MRRNLLHLSLATVLAVTMAGCNNQAGPENQRNQQTQQNQQNGQNQQNAQTQQAQQNSTGINGQRLDTRKANYEMYMDTEDRIQASDEMGNAGSGKKGAQTQAQGNGQNGPRKMGQLGNNEFGLSISSQDDAVSLGRDTTYRLAANRRPKNVIFMVGDGMGIGQMEVARLMEHGKEGQLYMQTLPHVAFVQTYSANNIVTDSAAAATALATGFKTDNEKIGVNPAGREVDSILDLFKQAGKKVGVISTNTVTDATPAGFTASIPNRWLGQEDIARQQLEAQVDVILGGGAKTFRPTDKNPVNYIDEFQKRGYTYVSDRDQLDQAQGDKLLGLFHDSYMNYKLDREEMNSNEPTLKEMTQKAIEVLNRGNQGFFVMVEGARIDHAAHAADITSIWKETVEFDEAVRYATDWAKIDGNTLVVVLADHETMGIAAAEPMDLQKLKEIQVSPEFMASKLVADPATGDFTADSLRAVFKQYANIELTDAEIASFNQRVKDRAGKVYASYRIGWEIGSLIASHNSVGVMSSDVRTLSGTGGHTANMAPLFAYGVGAENFDGVLDNTDIPRMLAKMMGYQSNNIRVYVKTTAATGETEYPKISFPVQPYVANGRTLVPIREISEALGSTVEWDAATRKVTMTKGNDTVTLVIGQANATKNGTTLPLEVPAQITNGKTFLPLRFVSEALGAKVTWEEASRSAVIE
ncbi:alkaline phosphatase [Brevibacillus dissolubilis]|uniref:alkaline phosphatase n=1 Tax=Brevibacillus dissolubilis TaxID=1844116 RepID=UPI00159BC2D1|nr:alkaline phosphatase [Brevibacillus dissolubilis]